MNCILSNKYTNSCLQRNNLKIDYLYFLISFHRYSQAELTEMYANCIKLSAENKINVKNAFKLPLIDYIAEMMKSKVRYCFTGLFSLISSKYGTTLQLGDQICQPGLSKVA